MEALLQYLGSFDHLTEDFVKDFQRVIKTNEFQKGHYLLKAGSVSEHMHYIEKGCVECYIGLKSMKETLWFMIEGEIAVFKNSFYDRIVSEGSIVALEDTRVFSISYTDLERLYEQHPFLERIGRKITEFYHKRSDIKSYILYPRRPEVRFDRFNKYRPDIVDRVSQKHLASFLGMREETLSRVMKEKQKK
ncbi:MAG TPA: cyclic nucleotide-binding domain-containing protein [Puia sp.]